MVRLAAAAGLLLAPAVFSLDLPDLKSRGVLRVIAAADEQPESAATWNRLVLKYSGDQALEVLGRKP